MKTIKLSKIHSNTHDPIANYGHAEYQRGKEFALDEITPKVAAAFLKYSAPLERTIFDGTPVWAIPGIDRLFPADELFKEFLKQYNP